MNLQLCFTLQPVSDVFVLCFPPSYIHANNCSFVTSSGQTNQKTRCIVFHYHKIQMGSQSNSVTLHIDDFKNHLETSEMFLTQFRPPWYPKMSKTTPNTICLPLIVVEILTIDHRHTITANLCISLNINLREKYLFHNAS